MTAVVGVVAMAAVIVTVVVSLVVAIVVAVAEVAAVVELGALGPVLRAAVAGERLGLSVAVWLRWRLRPWRWGWLWRSLWWW